MNPVFKTVHTGTSHRRINPMIRHAVFLVRHAGELFLHAFFSLAVSPAPCVLCGAPTLTLSLCPACRRLLDEEAHSALSENRRCSQCGRPLLSEHGVCTTCRDTPLFAGLDGVFPVFTYILSKKKLLYSWKIGRQHNLSALFASYFAEVMRMKFPDAAVVPVPPRPGKVRKTGWDQIEDIAQYLEHVHGIRVLRILRRTEAIQQKKLTKEERAEHSKHAYVIDERAVRRLVKAEPPACSLHSSSDAQPVLPRHVVLLDDVITTGSTILACASVLKNAENFKKAGIKGEVFIEKVSAASLFIVPG